MSERQIERLGWEIGGLPLADLHTTYESGTLLEFNNVRYHRKENGISGKSSGTEKFFTAQVGSEATIGDTNMMNGSQLEKGHWFTVKKLGVKVRQRAASGSESLADKQWYQRVLNTLFAYGIIRFRISGLDHLGEFPLSQLLPAVQSVGQLGATVTDGEGASIAASSNTAPIMAAGVFDLHENNIKLSEQVNFWCELIWDIPSKRWNGAENRWDNMDKENPLDLELMVVPDNTVVELQLIGQEMRMQG